jgi:signal transduction histidine kinase
VNPFRSVGALLSIALSVVVVIALLIVYFVLVPSLRSVIDTKMSQLEKAAPVLRNQFRRTGKRAPVDFVERAAAHTEAERVVIYCYFTATLLNVCFDSRGGETSADVEDDPVADRAQAKDQVQHGIVSHQRRRFAEVAIPLAAEGQLILLLADVEPQFQTIHIVKRRLLLAGFIALLVALALGYGGAWAFARRIRRLERAAERIAGGRFDEPVVDPSQDELGELARAFDRMRVRLAQLDDARRAFIANASHELRTPLFSLGGFLELMDDEDLDEETRQEFLDAMREQVARLTRLATDLLDLSRLDAGRIHVERQQLELEPLARSVAEEFSAVAQANDHPLEVAAGGRPLALGDPERVLQIGRLLVENAIVHTPPGTLVRLRVGAEDGRAVLAVEDEGPGIPPEHTEQVFERFYRADGGRSSGSGLGLAIARELARLMGGTIGLRSRPGMTTFALSLPAVAEDTKLSRETSLSI